MKQKLRHWTVMKAFTLVELLVVVALLVLCACMVFPALAKTRPNVRAVQCLNNLKQWSTAMQLYSNNNSENLPRDGISASGVYPGAGPDGTPNDLNAWFNLLPQLIGENTLQSYYNSAGGASQLKLPFPGRKGPVWHCPGAYMSDADIAQVSGGGAEGFFSYVMNLDLKKQDASVNTAYPGMPRLTTFQKPAATVLFFDNAFNPRTEVVNGGPQFNSVNPANRWKSFVARHGNGGSISFLDGHVKIFSAYSVTNGSGNNEALRPDIIWNAPYRVANP
jgi:prepilin-type processing-associated H-X9-DG protein/prepilin-type N-terminal cleavage/methylation domain-containing protein